MGPREMFCTSQLFDMENDRDWDHAHPHPDPRLHFESGLFILPVENAAVGGVNSMACFNMSLRSNDLPLPNFGSEIPNYRAANTRTPHDPYLHSSSAGSSSRVPPNYIQHGAPCYNQFAVGAISSTVNPQMDYGRAPFKRKAPSFSMAFDSGSTDRYYSAGSSSSLHVSSDPLQPKPISVPQCWPRDPTSMGPSYGSNNLLIAGEGFQRNVRSRPSHALQLEINPSGTHLSRNLPHRILPANISGQTVAGQWSHTPPSMDTRRRVIPSDVGRFSHEMNRSLAGTSVSSSSSMEIDGGYHSNLIPSRNPSTPLRAFHAPSTRGMGLGHGSHHGQRTPYRAIPSYRPMGFAATLEDGRRPGVEAVAPLRHSRPLSIIGRSSERVGRTRNIYGRFQPFSDEDNARNRWVSEGVAIMDHRSTTLFDSGSLFDQHHDMRLDVDNMSYEELLALEERIGNVSTGLSKDTVSKCLEEMIYSCDQNQEDGNCIICLEEYEDRASLGRLNCGHDFHSSCIKKWLLIKNVCPICKASAVEDTTQ